MDELAVLRDFRLEDADPSEARERARRALSAAMRRRRTRRRIAVAAAFVGAAILAGAAYGVVRELIVGDPAPPEVREQPTRFGHSAELIPVPHPDDPQLEQARVAAILDSSVGRVYLFGSPNARGLCVSSWIEGDRGYQGRLNMSSVCGEAKQSFYAFGEREYDGKTVRLFFGRAGDAVARVALRFGDRVIPVPRTGRTFLAEFPEWPDEFISYESDGSVLERRPFLRPGAVRGAPAEQPHQVTRTREVARIQARDGAEQVRLLVADASDGGYCQIVRSDRTPTNLGCSTPRPAATEIGVDAMNYGGAPTGILLLVGPVGSEIATLELRYEDGRRTSVPIHSGWMLYEIDRRDYAEGRRPTVLIARDASGRQLDTTRLPWASAQTESGGSDASSP